MLYVDVQVNHYLEQFDAEHLYCRKNLQTLAQATMCTKAPTNSYLPKWEFSLKCTRAVHHRIKQCTFLAK